MYLLFNFYKFSFSICLKVVYFLVKLVSSVRLFNLFYRNWKQNMRLSIKPLKLKLVEHINFKVNKHAFDSVHAYGNLQYVS